MFSSPAKLLAFGALAATLSLASGGARAESYPTDVSSARVATEGQATTHLAAKKRIARSVAVSRKLKRGQ